MKPFATTFVCALAALGLSSAFVSAQTIPDQIETILSRSAIANNTWTIAIENESGSVRLYQKNPTTGKPPASNTKIFTTSAAFALLGTNHVFESRVYLEGTLSGGTLTGNVNLVSEHDMTWNDSTFGSGNARKALDFIAGKLKTNGLNTVTGNVRCYGVCYYDRDSTDTSHNSESASTYNGQAATAFLAALQAKGISVGGAAEGKSGFTVPGSLFYTYGSTNLTYGGKPLRLDVACIPLMKVSHNVMADELLRHIGYKLTGTDSLSAGRGQLLTWMQNTAHVATNGITMNDGSGLSWNNRFTAQQILSLTRYMVPAYPSWTNTLPISCTDGTLGGRLCSSDVDGLVRAKTGSLSVSIALSGYVDNKHDGQRYFFSFVAYDGNASVADPIDDAASRTAIDDCVTLIGGRGLPTTPQILSVTNRGNGNSLAVTWSDEKFPATSYKVYASSDGVNFGSPVNVSTNTHSYTLSGLTPEVKRYFRVTVVNGTNESSPSRVYGAQVGTNLSKVVIVDGFDRWTVFPAKNPSASNHRFAAIMGESISGPAFDTVNHNAVLNSSIPLANYKAVCWMDGEESTQDETFSASEETLVQNYLSAGGNLFVSGSEIGWDLDKASGPTTADRTFYHNQLRALLNGDSNDDANTYSFMPTASGIFAGNTPSGFDNGTFGTYDVTYPDRLTPTNGSVPVLSYVGGSGGNAALTYDNGSGGGKLVNFGFPFETITNATARQAYMSDILRFFDVLDAPRVVGMQMNPQQNTLALSWNTSAGLKYRLQYKTDLGQASWTDVAPDILATNTTVSVTNSVGSGQKFYRILLVN